MEPTGKLYLLAVSIVPLIIAIVFHEVAHGWVARYFGDNTAEREGRLSLNPLKHVDPLGTVILPLLLRLFNLPVFGWAKPVPVNPNRLRNPRWHMVAVAAAGPVSNLLMAIIACILAYLVVPIEAIDVMDRDPVTGFVQDLLGAFMAINIFLAVFNMLPIPPFDGSRVLAGVLPPELGAKIHELDKYAMLFMMVFLVIIPQFAPQLNILNAVVGVPAQYIFNAIDGTVASLFGLSPG